jgi:hypothetical protein
MRLTQTVWQIICLINLSAKIGLCVGFGFGVLVLRYGSRMDTAILLFLCPFSIAGMALDSASVNARIFGIFVILIANAIWYAFLFGLAGILWKQTGAQSGDSTR